MLGLQRNPGLRSTLLSSPTLAQLVTRPAGKPGSLQSPWRSRVSSAHRTLLHPALPISTATGRVALGLQSRDNLAASVAARALCACATPSSRPRPLMLLPGNQPRSAPGSAQGLIPGLRASNEHGSQPASARPTNMVPNRPPVSNCFLNREAAMTQQTTPWVTGS